MRLHGLRQSLSFLRIPSAAAKPGIWEALYFLATPERYKRSYDGLNTHMMYLQPNALIMKLLRDKAKTGDFLPYTNTEQDVIETAFSPHASGVTEASRFPRHDHFRGCSGKEKEQHRRRRLRLRLASTD